MPDTNELSLSEIGQIAVTVKDLDRAVAFYRDKLRMKLLFTAPPALAFFDCNGIRLMLDIPAEEEFKHPSSIIYFNVADIQSAFQTLSARGVSIVAEPRMIAPMDTYDLWMAFFRDSEDNVLSIMSNVPRS